MENKNKKKEENDKKLESLRREHDRAIEDFNQKKSNDAGKEKIKIKNIVTSHIIMNHITNMKIMKKKKIMRVRKIINFL